jgi:hypothetical protein
MVAGCGLRRHGVASRRAFATGNLVHHLFGDVEVRPDVLDVVLVVEHLHEPEHLLRLLLVELDVGRGDLPDLRFDRGDLRALEGLPDLLEGLGRRVDLEHLRLLGLQVVRPRFERDFHQLVLADGALLDGEVALPLELEADGARRAHVPAIFLEGVADLRRGAVGVVGHGLDHDRDAARPVAFVRELFVRDAVELTGAALDGAVDVVLGHVARLRFRDGGTETGVAVDVASAEAGGDGHFLDDAREDLAALGVRRTLLVLDGAPFAVA